MKRKASSSASSGSRKRRKTSSSVRLSRAMMPIPKCDTYRCSLFTTFEIPTLTGASYNQAWSWKLSDGLNHAQFGSGYDEYRIVKVYTYIQLAISPNASCGFGLQTQTISNNTGASATITGFPGNTYPRVWYAHDHNEANGEAVDTIKLRQGVKMAVLKPDRILRIVSKPKPVTVLYQSNPLAPNAYGSVSGSWIRRADADVRHYGLICTYDNHLQNNVATPIRAEHRMIVEFRQARK